MTRLFFGRPEFYLVVIQLLQPLRLLERVALAALSLFAFYAPWRAYRTWVQHNPALAAHKLGKPSQLMRSFSLTYLVIAVFTCYGAGWLYRREVLPVGVLYGLAFASALGPLLARCFYQRPKLLRQALQYLTIIFIVISSLGFGVAWHWGR